MFISCQCRTTTSVHSPVIHLHVLPVEKENGGRDVTNVKVSGVDWSLIDINNVDGRHVTQVMGRFRQLGKTKQHLARVKH